jgi:hypothetical protein
MRLAVIGSAIGLALSAPRAALLVVFCSGCRPMDP